MRRAVPLLLAVAIVASCADVETGPNVPVSLEFAELPFPAVVAGDTLRDSSGAVAPLRALVFNSDNEEIVNAPVRFTALAAVVTVDSVSGIVVAGTVADTSVRIVASLDRLQSTPLRLSVVPRPDSLAPSGTIDTLRYSLIDTTRNVSGELAVKVLHRSQTATVPVRDWLVTFTLENAADSLRAHVISADNRRSSVDTTAADGSAARRIRLLTAGLTSARDSVVVVARARHRGTHLAGSPLRLVVHVQPVAP